MKGKSIFMVLTALLFVAGTCMGCENRNSQQVEGDTEQSSSKTQNSGTVSEEEDEHYIFELNENVNRTAVTYKNRYGITLSGDLYTAKNLDTNTTYPALVIGPPYGGVKEQGPGVYANELAQRGFVVLTFDPSFNGESGGEPRHVSSPDIFTEDFSAGVDYLGTLEYVERSQIGAIGICGSGGFALAAAQVDTRIKAVATASLFDVSAFGNGLDTEQWAAEMESLSQERWEDVDNDEAQYIPTYPEKPTTEIPAELEGIWAEFYSFYGMERGHHPRALGGFTTTSNSAFYNFQLLNHLDKITQPILFMAGENAETRSISENAYELVTSPKELYIAPEANHVDLYDNENKIPFDKLESFFKSNFR